MVFRLFKTKTIKPGHQLDFSHAHVRKLHSYQPMMKI